MTGLESIVGTQADRQRTHGDGSDRDVSGYCCDDPYDRADCHCPSGSPSKRRSTRGRIAHSDSDDPHRRTVARRVTPAIPEARPHPVDGFESVRVALPRPTMSPEVASPMADPSSEGSQHLRVGPTDLTATAPAARPFRSTACSLFGPSTRRRGRRRGWPFPFGRSVVPTGSNNSAGSVGRQGERREPGADVTGHRDVVGLQRHHRSTRLQITVVEVEPHHVGRRW